MKPLRKQKTLCTFLVASLLWISALFDGMDAHAGERVKWISINSRIGGLTSLSDLEGCRECHAEYIKGFERTKHARAFRAGLGKGNGLYCEECHGPLGNHRDDPVKEAGTQLVVSFKNISSDTKNRICMQCHEKGLRMDWRGSPHEATGVSCTNCHYVTKKRSKRTLFIYEDSKNACFQCHRGLKAKLLRNSHHPLREGKMDCASCHNPHGGHGPSLLKMATVNETCTSCHQEKRGPYVWEHAPVRESCLTCHEAHGSNFSRLMKRKAPFICNECHVSGGHVSSLKDGSALGSQFFRGKSCLNCHSKIHGSNHPSGARLQR